MMTNTIPYRRTKTHVWDKVLMGFLVHPAVTTTAITINIITIIALTSSLLPTRMCKPSKEPRGQTVREGTVIQTMWNYDILGLTSLLFNLTRDISYMLCLLESSKELTIGCMYLRKIWLQLLQSDDLNVDGLQCCGKPVSFSIETKFHKLYNSIIFMQICECEQ